MVRSMKKFIIVLMVFVVGAIMFGAGWNLNHHKEYSIEKQTKEIALRGEKINQLEDSIMKLNEKVEKYHSLFRWLSNADSAEVEKVIDEL